MKYYEYNIDSNKVEFFNSYCGKETVFVNGIKTSQKFSITGSYHFFKIDYDQILLKTDYEFFINRKININLFKNKQLIDFKNIELEKKHRFILVGIGLFIGFCIIKLYNSI